jgi:hypothetical protein
MSSPLVRPPLAEGLTGLLALAALGILLLALLPVAVLATPLAWLFQGYLTASPPIPCHCQLRTTESVVQFFRQLLRGIGTRHP